MQTISLPFSSTLEGNECGNLSKLHGLEKNLPLYQPDGTPTEALIQGWIQRAEEERRSSGGNIWVFLQPGLLKECTFSIQKTSEKFQFHLTPLPNKEINKARLNISFDQNYQLHNSEDVSQLLHALGLHASSSSLIFSSFFSTQANLAELVPNSSAEGYLHATNGQLWATIIRCIRVRGDGENLFYDLQLEFSVYLLSHLDIDPETQETSRLRQENKSLHRIQQILRRSMTRLKVLAEYSPDIIMQFDRQHRHLFVNSQVEKLTPWTAEEYLGKTHEEIGFPQDFCDICSEALDYVFTTGNSHRQEIILPGGNYIDWFLIPEVSKEGVVDTVITTARDITEQRLTEHRLMQSEQRMKDAFKVTKLSSWEFILETNELSMSEEFRELLGLSDKEELNGTQYIQQFVYADDMKRFKHSIKEARNTANPDFQQIIDYRITQRSGDVLTILVSLRVELSEEGKVEKLYGTCQDITQIRLTEQELEEYQTSLEQLVETRTQELKRSEAKLADALRIANLGTWEYDISIGSYWVSDEVLEILGTTSEIEEGNFIEVNFVKSILHPEDFEKFKLSVYEARDALSENFSKQVEVRVRTTQQEWRTLLLSIRVNKNRLGSHFFGTLQDITSMRTVAQEKERLTGIIETTPDIIAIAKPDGHMTYLNAAGRQFFGIHNDEALQRRSFFSFQSRKARRVVTSEELSIAADKGVWSGEHRFMRFDGSEIPVSQIVIAHKNSDGQVEYYSTILRDISAQKRIEEDLIFKNNELDTFLYRASHDLRGPIATMLGLYNVAQFEVKDEGALSMLDLYNSQAIRLNNITSTLIELTKLKERECTPELVNFKELVKQTIQELQRLTESQDMLFHYDVENIDGFTGDAHLIAIILQNLVENSIKYKRQEVDSFVKVQVKSQPMDNRVLIKVSDNGMGIDPEIQNRIFHMFFRGSERSKGSGLGLYVLKNAVDKLGGQITLYSVPYKGTTFKISLPTLKICNKQLV